jgi:hypothetical protein
VNERRDLSIVVIPIIGQDILANCLDRLPLGTVECIVVLRQTMGISRSWEQRYGLVTFLDATNDPIPMRRKAGIEIATRGIVGLIEDTSWPDEGWCMAAQSAFEDPETVAAGGPVRIDTTLPSRCQALGWSEYGAFAPHRLRQASPLGAGADQPMTAARVPGNNMAFRRAELIEAMGGQENGLFEVLVCSSLLLRGRRVVYQPRMSVTYVACDRHNALLATRAHHGRIYAAAQVRGRGWPARLVHVAKVPFLPFLLTARITSQMAGSGRLIARLPVLLWIVLMEGAWALGEMIGALAGAGKSLKEWR